MYTGGKQNKYAKDKKKMKQNSQKTNARGNYQHKQ